MAEKKNSVGVIFTFIGISIAVFGLYLTVSTVQFVERSLETTGEVVSVNSSYDRDSDDDETTTYQPLIRFKSRDGTQHEALTHLRSSEYDYSIGARVEVLYDPAKLDQVRINSFWSLYLFPGVFTVLGLVFLIGGTWSWIGRRRKARVIQSASPATNQTVRRSRDL